MTVLEVSPQTTEPDMQEDNTLTHIVGPIHTDEGIIQGRTRIMEAMINGTPLEALCGFVWVPTKNPDNYPLCEACLNISRRRED